MGESEPNEVAKLTADRLYRPADLSGLAFTTTEDLEPQPDLLGQERASEAIRFATGIGERGFNLFAIGASAAQVREAVGGMLRALTAFKPCPPDWVYVNNFATPNRPLAISMPPGRGPEFQSAMRRLAEDLRSALPAVFEGEDYQARRSAIETQFRSRGERAFQALGEKAAAKETAILRTPAGFAVAPARGGKVVPAEEFNTWPEEQRRAAQASVQEIEHELEQTLRGIPRIEKERRDAVRALDREVASFAIGQLIEEVHAHFADLPKIAAHLEAVRADILDNTQLFVAAGAEEETPLASLRTALLDRYQVNVLVTCGSADVHRNGHAPAVAAPVVEELHPTLGNLVGRTEYLSQQGVLVTNFMLIKAGALHRANGGAVLIDARSLLSEPFSWPALKRALTRGEILIEDPGRFLGLAMTATLEPDPIPLDVKVVLFGERVLYYLLASLDPDFATLFKVLADFEDDTPRTQASEAAMARLIGGIVRSAGFHPFDRGAVARLIEHAARLADDQVKLTLLVERVRDAMAEADYLARGAGRAVVTRADVGAAIRQQIRRSARIEDRSREMILRGIALVDTEGRRIGQVNGLSVMMMGGHAFGRPSRITCRVRPGGGKIVDIEREVALGGPLHSKGVLILSGFLAGRYALDQPMSLYASLVFEQSYGGVDGDSASSAELYALLSALGEIPLRQDLAITGSVNQHGIVQAIGGVNEKIEGFFDVCAARGLSGSEGVLIPASNVQHLMLREDVVDACASGRFAIYPITTIDEGIALLAGQPAGARGADGAYPEGSVNRRVEERLRQFAEIRRKAAEETEERAKA
ncbi:MAG TPA: ATP-binding protein [Acetobacteraceae bacterium]|nr:ATP-binding protein [Acetobacteraceae bacterium]